MPPLPDFDTALGGDSGGDGGVAGGIDGDLAAIAGCDGIGVDRGLADRGGSGHWAQALRHADCRRSARCRRRRRPRHRSPRRRRPQLAAPSTLTVPPVWPAPLPDAFRVPELATVPLSASRMISPFSWRTELASTMPVLLTTASCTPWAARAVIRTRAAGGGDLAAVQNLAAGRIGADGIVEKMVAGEIDREGVGAAQHDMTGTGPDDPRVDHAGRRQNHRAALAGGDGAIVGDAAIAAGAGEIVACRRGNSDR